MTWPLIGELTHEIPESQQTEAMHLVRDAIVATLARWDLRPTVEVAFVDGALHLTLDRPLGDDPVTTQSETVPTRDRDLAHEVHAVVGSEAGGMVAAVAARVWWARLGRPDEPGGRPPPWFAGIVADLVSLGEDFKPDWWGLEEEDAPRDKAEAGLLVEWMRDPAGQPVRLAANNLTLGLLITGLAQEPPASSWDRLLVDCLGVLGTLTPPVSYDVDASLPDGLVQVCLGRLPLGAVYLDKDVTAGSQADGVARHVAELLASNPHLLPSLHSVKNLLDDLSHHVGSGHTVWFAEGTLTTHQLVYVIRQQLADGHPLCSLPTLLREVLARVRLVDPVDVGLGPALAGALERMRTG